MSKENLTLEEFKSMFRTVKGGKQFRSLDIDSKFLSLLNKEGRALIGPVEIEGEKILYCWYSEPPENYSRLHYYDEKIDNLMDLFDCEFTMDERINLSMRDKEKLHKDSKNLLEANELISKYDLIANTTYNYEYDVVTQQKIEAEWKQNRLQNLTLEEFKGMFGKQTDNRLSNLQLFAEYESYDKELEERKKYKGVFEYNYLLEDFVGPPEVQGKSVLYFWFDAVEVEVHEKKFEGYSFSDKRIEELSSLFYSKLSREEIGSIWNKDWVENHKDDKNLSEALDLISKYDFIADITWGWQHGLC